MKKREFWYSKLGWTKWSPMWGMLEYRKRLPRSIPPRRKEVPHYDIIISRVAGYRIERVLVKNYMSVPVKDGIEELGRYATLKAAINNAGKIIRESGRPMP